MKRRTLARGDLGMAVAAALPLGGCPGETANTPTCDGTLTRTAFRELAEAASRLQQDTYRRIMTVTVGDDRRRLTGVIDPEQDVGAYKVTIDRNGWARTEWRVIGNVVYMKIATPGGIAAADGKPWRRISPGATTADWYDGAAITKYPEPAADVQRIGDTGFKRHPRPDCVGRGHRRVGTHSQFGTPVTSPVHGRHRRHRTSGVVLSGPSVVAAARTRSRSRFGLGVAVNVQAPPSSRVSTTPSR